MFYARHVDDDAVLAGEHMRQQSLHAVERALDIEREGLLHQRVIDLEKFGAANGGAGGIEQELDAAESCDRAFSHVVDLGPLGDVDLDSQRPAALPVDLRSRFVSAFLVDVGANDIGAFARPTALAMLAAMRRASSRMPGPAPLQFAKIQRQAIYLAQGGIHRSSRGGWCVPRRVLGRFGHAGKWLGDTKRCPIMRTPSVTWLVGADAVGIATAGDIASPDSSLISW